MTGDVLVVRRGPEAQPHYGIDWGGGQIAHVQAGGTAAVVPSQIFSRGFPVYLARPVAPAEVPGIVARVQSQLDRPYNLLTFNCETLVHYAVTSEFRSWTVEGVVKLGAFLFIALAVAATSTWPARPRR
jgi:hypothetical protein